MLYFVIFVLKITKHEKFIYAYNTYQFRVVIPDYATIYFPQKKLLIKSLETSDKQNAIKYSKILMQKYKFIIESIKMAIDINTIKQLVNDFLSTRFYDTEKDLYNCPNPINIRMGLALSVSRYSVKQRRYRS